jgi:hypothetical protein
MMRKRVRIVKVLNDIMIQNNHIKSSLWNHECINREMDWMDGFKEEKGLK